MNDEEMCSKGAPICWAVLACVIVMTVSIALDTYASWQYRSQVQAELMFVKCVSGESIQFDDRIVTCQISKPILRGI